MNEIEKVEIQKYMSELPDLSGYSSNDVLLLMHEGQLCQVSVAAFQANTLGNAYVRPTATSQDVGGIKPGNSFNGTVQNVLDSLLYPKQQATITISPFLIQEKGTSYDVLVSGNIDAGDSTISNRRFLRNGQEIKVFGNNTISFNESRSSNTTYTLEITSNLGKVSQIMMLEFTPPTFAGTMNFASFEANIIGATPTSTSLENLLQKLLRKKSDLTHTFSPNAERYVVGYPKSFGEVRKITDQSGFLFMGFTRYEVSIQLADGTPEEYFFYISQVDNTWDSFSFTFSH